MSFMDAREAGSKPGSGGHASAQNEVTPTCCRGQPQSDAAADIAVAEAVRAVLCAALLDAQKSATRIALDAY